MSYFNKKERLLRRPEVEYMTGLSKASLYRLMQEDSFPRPINLGPRTVAWPESEVDEWIEKQISSRNRR